MSNKQPLRVSAALIHLSPFYFIACSPHRSSATLHLSLFTFLLYSESLGDSNSRLTAIRKVRWFLSSPAKRYVDYPHLNSSHFYVNRCSASNRCSETLRGRICERASLNTCSKMTIASALGANHIGMISLPHSKQPLHVRHGTARFYKANIFQRVPTGISKRGGHLYADQMGFNHAASGRDNQQLRFNDEWPPPEPFFLSLIKETVWGLRSLLIFLVEQPSQLKYIEWPSFQSTLKTATLALVLVALLIVALSSVDSVLSFILTLSLRRTS